MSDYTEPIALPPDDDTAGLPVPVPDYVPPYDPDATPEAGPTAPDWDYGNQDSD